MQSNLIQFKHSGSKTPLDDSPITLNDTSQIQEIVVRRIGSQYDLCFQHQLDPARIMAVSEKIDARNMIPHDINSAQDIMLGLISVSKAKTQISNLFHTESLEQANQLVSSIANKTVDFVATQADFAEPPPWEKDGAPLGKLRQDIYNKIRDESNALCQPTNIYRKHKRSPR